MRRIPSNLFLLLAALAGIASSACQSGGVGDPCIPEDEYKKSFSGYSETEVNVESRSFQCETRVCLVANFKGRVSCPYGQVGNPLAKDPLTASQANANVRAEERCYIPGTKMDPTPNTGTAIDVPVPAQLAARPTDKAVYCSCRCAGPDQNVRYCQCPSGYACQKLVTDYGFGSGQLAGSYCIKDGTQVPDSTQLSSGNKCLILNGQGNCGDAHPNNIKTTNP